ncbi:MAG TPA: mechanosensitive ion channel family protein [Clostridia bacterium]
MEDLKNIWWRFVDIFSHTFLEVEIWRIIAAGLIIILALAVRKVFLNMLISALKKLTGKTKSTVDDKLVEAVDPPGKLLIIVIALYFVFRVLLINVSGDSFGGHIIRTLFIFTLFWMIYRAAGIIAHLFEGFAKKTETDVDDMLLPFINKGIKVIVVIVGITVIAKEWRYDLGALLTGLGLGGLAFALAAQETLANMFGGMTIMLDKPFLVGDWILTQDVEGIVEDIGFRSTRIRTFAQALVTVPNSTLAKTAITNWSKMGKRRINFSLRIKYQTTAEKMNKLLEKIREMLANHPEIHPQTIFVFFDKFGENGYEMFFNFFTKTTIAQKYFEVKEDINLKIMQILDELGIEIAFPATSVYIENEKDGDVYEAKAE